MTPDWVKEFRKKALEITRISHHKVFEYPQDSLDVLKTRGKGCCVSWSKLVTEIAIKHKIDYTQYIVDDNTKKEPPKITLRKDIFGNMWLQSVEYTQSLVNDSSKKDWEDAPHQVTLLEDRSGQMWLQSNECIKMVDNEAHMLKIIPNMVATKWPFGCYILSKFKYRESDLR